MIDTREFASGKVSLLNVMGEELTIVNAARVSFAKRKDLMDNSDEKLLKYLWKHKHTSPFEKVSFLFHVRCPIPIAKQWMRHRTWSYNEISRRYTDEDIQFYVPDVFRNQSNTNKQSSDGVHPNNSSIKVRYRTILSQAKDLYEAMVREGVAKEQARFILPQALMTEFYAKTDLKNLLDFLNLRRALDAQEEIRDPANAIAEMIAPLFPITMGVVEKGRWVWEEGSGV